MLESWEKTATLTILHMYDKYNGEHAKTYKIVKQHSIRSLLHVLYRGEQQVAPPYSFIDIAVLEQIERKPGTYGMSNEM